MSKKVGANIGCPQCNHETPAELYRTIWVEEPRNRELILSDRINAFTCARCKFSQRLEYPFLATNARRRFALWYEPYHDEQIDADAEAYRKQFGKDNFLAVAPRIADWEDFKRTLLKMEADAPAPSATARDVRGGTPHVTGRSAGAAQRSSRAEAARRGWFSRVLAMLR